MNNNQIVKLKNYLKKKNSQKKKTKTKKRHRNFEVTKFV